VLIPQWAALPAAPFLLLKIGQAEMEASKQKLQLPLVSTFSA